MSGVCLSIGFVMSSVCLSRVCDSITLTYSNKKQIHGETLRGLDEEDAKKSVEYRLRYLIFIDAWHQFV